MSRLDEASAVATDECAPSVPGRMPDFFIVGHPKCGTTALYRTLKRHPQIFMPALKEPWFFVPELRSRYRHASDGRPETLAQYRELFAPARSDQRAGEASPSYLMSHTAAERIAQVQPDARIVAILREPASFLRSLHLQFVQNHIETETDLRKALALEGERRQGRSIPRHSPRPQTLLYSDLVRYVDQLRRYHEVFPREQVLVLVYEDFRADNQGAIREVLRFLEVDDALPVELAEANPTVRVRSQRLHELLRAVSVGRGPLSRSVKRSLKVLTPGSVRRPLVRTLQRKVIFGDPGTVDEQLMSELRRRFEGEVRALSEYLARDLVSRWSYDQL